MLVCLTAASPVPLQSIDRDVLSGDKARLRGCKECDHLSNVLGCTNPFQRNAFDKLRLTVANDRIASNLRLDQAGQTQFTRISGPSSLANDLVMPMIPAFAAA